VAVPVSTGTYPDYKIDWQEVRKKVTAKNKSNHHKQPHNPTGSVLTENDIEQLRTLLKTPASLSSVMKFMNT
jgi:methionine aminotransferase